MLSYNVEESERTPADDDSPDCTGGIFSLAVMNTMSGKILQIPFPAGFDSVLDYEFSPDDHNIAVTFGAASCDYPGDVARVYTVSLPAIELAPVSRADRLAVQARWSPNGRAIIYQDYTGSDSPLMVFDLATQKTSRLTSPGQLGPDNFLGWR